MASAAAPGASTQELSPERKKDLRRVIAGSAMGNGIEWYDYALFGYLLSAIQANILPGDLATSTTGTVLLFIIFAVPFLFRPLGATIFGAIGDRVGRQRILALTVLLISGGTFLIGLLPSFSVIGWAAPVILILLRIVQGLAAGGEYGGAATFMAEHSPDHKRGFYGSFLEFGTLAGFLAGASVGALLQGVMTEDAYLSYGWRIPFLLAAPIGLFGLYIRSRLEETPVFKELAAQENSNTQAKTQFKDLLTHWRPVVLCAGMVIMLNVINYTLFVYVLELLADPARGGLSGSWSLGLLAIMYAIMMVFMPSAGALSDRVGRRPMWFFSGIATLLLTLPGYYLLLNGSIGAKLAALIVLGLVYVPQLATISATFPAMFPTQIRFTAFALTYNVFTMIGGGTPALNEVMSEALTPYFPAFLIMASCVVGLVAVYFAPETSGASLRGTKVPDIEKDKALAGKA